MNQCTRNYHCQYWWVSHEKMIGINHSETLLHNSDPYIRLTGVPELRSTKGQIYSGALYFFSHCIVKREWNSHPVGNSNILTFIISANKKHSEFESPKLLYEIVKEYQNNVNIIEVEMKGIKCQYKILQHCQKEIRENYSF